MVQDLPPGDLSPDDLSPGDQEPGGGRPAEPTVPRPADRTRPMAVPPAASLPSPPVTAASGAAPGPPAETGGRRLWREATATSGATLATFLALALATVMFFAVATTAVVLAIRQDHRGTSMVQARSGPVRLNGQGGGTAVDRPGTRATGPVGLRGAQHGQLTEGNGTTYLVQRGEVTSASSSSLSVRSTDGYTGTYAVTSGTRFVGASSGVPSKGATVYVVATRDGDRAITVRTARTGAPDRPRATT